MATRAEGQRGPVPDHPAIDLPATTATPGASDTGGDASLTFIGTATVLLRLGPFTLLTDPNFLHAGEKAYLGLGLHSTRRTNPALDIADLPPLDAIVLSHHHGDHFDQVAARDLPKDVPIVTEPHAARKLRSQGFTRPVALETWERQVLRRGDAELRITSVPGKHAPQPLRALLPPVMGSVVDLHDGGRHRMRLYLTGDTLVHDELAEIPRRFPAIDLCLLHLGGTRIAGILLTMDAEQGVEALRIVAPEVAVPIHYDDYPVFRSPLSDFANAVAAADLATEIRYLARGETLTLPLRSDP